MSYLSTEVASRPLVVLGLILGVRPEAGVGGEIAFVLVAAALLTAVFAPLTTYLYRNRT